MNGSFILYGNDLLSDPDLAFAGGILSVTGGDAVFTGSQVVVFDVQDAAANGEFTNGTTLTGARVYATYEHYLSGTVQFNYSGTASVATGPEAMGDSYLVVDLAGLTSVDAGAPVLQETLLAPNSDATYADGDLDLAHQLNMDLNGDGSIGAVPELGNGIFNLSSANFLYQGATGEAFVVEGTQGDDEIVSGYLGDPDGDQIDNADAADGSDDDVIRAGAGNDTVVAGAGNDLIEGGAGDDRLEGGRDNDTIDGGTGHDAIWGGSGNDSVLGGSGNDSVEAYDGNDYVEGGDGDDWMNGDRGDDTLIGGAGNDWMRGSFGNELMEGGTGDDYIWSGYGDDTIRMENDFGNDTILMEGVDEVSGDVLDLTAITDDLTIDLGANQAGRGTLSDGTSTASFEDVEHLLLGSGNDTVKISDFGGSDSVTGFRLPEENGDGSYTVFDRLDLSGMTDEDGNPLGAGDVRLDADDAGHAVLIFPKGESLKLVGVALSDLSDLVQKAIGLPGGAEAPPVPGLDGVVSGTDEADVIDTDYIGDPDGDRVDGDDAIAAGAGPNDDVIEAGAGDDHVSAGAGNDLLRGEAGADTLDGGAGDDYLIGGNDNDSLIGGAGNDTLIGGDGNDSLVGGGGDSWLEGNDGEDNFYIGAGDIAFGGAGDDRFDINRETLEPGAELTIDGGSEGEDLGDRLEIYGPATITYDEDDAESGTVTWGNGATLRFSDIEKVLHVPCFTPDSQILTFLGEMPAAELKVGDRVMTRDDRFQPIRWIGRRDLTAAELAATPALRPVRIKAGALGDGLPVRDLTVSPQHRMLISGGKVALWFGEDEVFVPAVQLTCLDGVEQMDVTEVSYIHFMFDRHQLVLGDGAWSESFQPGDMTLAGMDQAQRAELLVLLPELAETAHSYTAARPTLSGQETRVLFGT